MGPEWWRAGLRVQAARLDKLRLDKVRIDKAWRAAQ